MNSSDLKGILNQEIKICDLHVSRIRLAIDRIQKLLPFTPQLLENLPLEQLGFLDIITGRFSKLQDTIGQKVFPLILEILQEDISKKSYLDRLYLLEKLGFLEKADYWVSLRNIRNALTHEYPDHPELIVKNLNQGIEACKGLLEYWEALKKLIQSKVV